MAPYIKIKKARASGRVRRFHTSQMVKEENVAEHTFNMMNLIMILTDGAPSTRLMTAALLHDQGEYVTGDIPSPVKRHIDAESVSELAVMEEAAVNFIHHRGAPKLEDWEHWLLKLADNLDGLLKCMEEYKMGNEDIVQVGDTYRVYIKKMLENSDGHAADITRHIISLYEKVTK